MKLPRPILCALLLCCGGAPAEDAPAGRGEIYRLFAGGDTLLARNLPDLVLEHGPAAPLGALAPLIAGADIALTNLECVIAARGRFWEKGESSPYYYRAPPFMLEVLTAAGFDVIMAANNHAMDFGPEALLEQLELLAAAGIAAIGAGRDAQEAAAPRYIQVGDLVLAVIGLTTYNSPIAARADRAGVHWTDNPGQIRRALAAAVAEARAHADIVVFSPHWGGNWTEGPSPERVELAHDLIDLGVDAILGHSAHQFHGVEIYRGRPIVYDMGNLLWDTRGSRRSPWSAAFVLDFDHSGFTRLSIHPLLLQPGRTVPATGADFERVRDTMLRLSAALDPAATFETTAQGLSIALDPAPRREPATRSPPPRLYAAGRVRLPDEARARRSNVVLDAPPDWARAQDPIRLTRGVEFLGARVPESVRGGSGFAAAVALRAGGPLGSGWQGMIRGVRRGGGDEFHWAHPVADGSWPPADWRPGETGLDLTLVRPPRITGGTYDLYWRLEHAATGEVLRPAAASAGSHDGFVPIGEIWVGSLGLPRGVAGVTWSGQLDARQRLLKQFGITREFILAAAWTGVAALVATVLAVLIAWVRRRRSAAA
jgi:poly-gamma-glutamate capsule biosynthesis protein CapA/YwtB (metallophosphatase superfamily)